MNYVKCIPFFHCPLRPLPPTNGNESHWGKAIGFQETLDRLQRHARQWPWTSSSEWGRESEYKAWLKGGSQVVWMLLARPGNISIGRNEIHKSWGPPFRRALHMRVQTDRWMESTVQRRRETPVVWMTHLRWSSVASFCVAYRTYYAAWKCLITLMFPSKSSLVWPSEMSPSIIDAWVMGSINGSSSINVWLRLWFSKKFGSFPISIFTKFRAESKRRKCHNLTNESYFISCVSLLGVVAQSGHLH